MNTGPAITVAVTFIWLGMVLAISFLEAPLKFRAPNVTLQIGLGIGRLVFRALNTVEVAFAVVILVIVVAGPTPARVGAASYRCCRVTQGVTEKCERGMGGHPPGGVSGGADR